MKKELARGGQVYYLHNRVDNIESCAAHVSQMVPGARVGIAHGKMTEEELNPVWQHLLNGEIDILVCTTLIETGIDVRNCNTLIIEDADRMGLAQLYQIRAAWAARAGKPTPTSPSGGTRPSPTSPRSAFRHPGVHSLRLRLPHRHARLTNSRRRQVCWATASTATWRPWAMTFTSRCWVRPSPGQG